MSVCILELRKEKSRDAARSRRGKENYEFYELAKLLPLPAAITSQLDKASIIRLSISYLKLRDFSGLGDPSWSRDSQHHKAVKGGHQRRRSHPAISVDLFESHQGTHILQSLDGFAFILGNDGRFLYISETVSIYLGLSQVEMAGSSMFDYVHQQDHAELAEHLGLGLPQASSSGVPSPGSSDDGSPATQRCVSPPGHENRGYVMNPDPKLGCDRSFCLRMKSTLTKRGMHVKSSGYRVLHVLGQLRPQRSLGLGRKGAGLLGLVGVAIAMPPPTITELKLEHDTFITRMSPDFTITYCEPLISEQMDLSADDVTNRSLYDLSHAGDLSSLRQAHLNVMNKGQAMTDYYRVMTRGGGYVWLQTCATTLLNGKNAEDQNILAINYVLSGVEKGHSVMNLWQMFGTDTPTPVVTSASSFTGHAQNGRCQDDKAGPVSTADDLGSGKDDQMKSHPAVCSPPHRPLHANNDVDNDVMSDDSAETGLSAYGGYSEKSEGASVDCKNNRRKMERPRKRKREEMECGEGDASPDSPGPESLAAATATALASGAAVEKKKNGGDLGRDSLSLGGGRPSSRDAGGVMSTPEDLSLKPSSSSTSASLCETMSSPSAEPAHKLTSSHGVLSSMPGPVVSDRDTPGSSWVENTTPGSIGASVGVSPLALASCSSAVATPSAVKELEAVMNRHLPFLEPAHLQAHSDVLSAGSSARLHGSSHSSRNIASNGNVNHINHHSNNNHYPAHRHQPQTAAKKSTIQWVGSHATAAAKSSSSLTLSSSSSSSLPSSSAISSTSSALTSASSSSLSSTAEGMAASSFLRSLYESRESVIRSCNSSSTGGGGGGGGGVGGGNGGGGVIKGSGTCGGVDGVAVEAGGPVYDDLGNDTLLTPPGSDLYKEHLTPFSIPSIVITSATPSLPPPPPLAASSSHNPSSSALLSSPTSVSSSASVANNNNNNNNNACSNKPLPGYVGAGGHLGRGGGYPASALSLTLPCGGGGGGVGGGGGGGLGDAYGMTPPSSVSPQDKLAASPFAAAAAALAYNESAAMHMGGSCGLARSSMHAASTPGTLGVKDAAAVLGISGGHGHHPDYTSSAKAAYYAMSSALNGAHHHHHNLHHLHHLNPASAHHSGYADVNHNNTATAAAVYDQCARPAVIPWY